MEAEFNVFTDFNQFTVADPTANFEDLYEKWTDETVESMFVQGDRYIAVGMMRNFYAPVLIRLNSERSFTGSVDHWQRRQNRGGDPGRSERSVGGVRAHRQRP